MSSNLSPERIKNQIRNVADFPKKGIQFKDITTVLKEPSLFAYVVDELASKYHTRGITKIACIESRGFIFGGALAAKLGAGFVPIRKPGKLPAEVFTKDYTLEYGVDAIEIHTDAIQPGDNILLHDDLLATGGTAKAAIELLRNFEFGNLYLSFMCELDFLKGRQQLENFEINSLIHF